MAQIGWSVSLPFYIFYLTRLVFEKRLLKFNFEVQSVKVRVHRMIGNQKIRMITKFQRVSSLKNLFCRHSSSSILAKNFYNRDVVLSYWEWAESYSGPPSRQVIFVKIKPYLILAIYMAILEGKLFQFHN